MLALAVSRRLPSMASSGRLRARGTECSRPWSAASSGSVGASQGSTSPWSASARPPSWLARPLHRSLSETPGGRACLTICWPPPSRMSPFLFTFTRSIEPGRSRSQVAPARRWPGQRGPAGSAGSESGLGAASRGLVVGTSRSRRTSSHMARAGPAGARVPALAATRAPPVQSGR